MAGLYIHLPFCKSRCIYCAFYSTTQHEVMDDYVTALCKEMELRSTPHSTLHPPPSTLLKIEPSGSIYSTTFSWAVRDYSRADAHG